MKEAFISTYNACADDIFSYCYERTMHRDIAKHLTRSIFMATWDAIAQYGAAIGSIKKTLFRTTRNQVKDFLSHKQSHVAFKENLWKITLSQGS